MTSTAEMLSKHTNARASECVTSEGTGVSPMAALNPAPAALFAVPAAGAGGGGGGGPPGGGGGRKAKAKPIPPEIRALHERRFRLEDLHDVVKGSADAEMAEREMCLHFTTLLYPLQHAYPVGDEAVRLNKHAYTPFLQVVYACQCDPA
jgi:hypothetical protein